MDNKFSTIKSRVIYLIEYHGDIKEKFFEKIGMTYGNFKGSAKNTPLNSTAIVNILSIYKDVNPEWLLTGTGAVLRQQSPTHQNNESNRVNELQEMIDMQRKLIKNMEAEVARLQSELEKTHNFPAHRMVAEGELTYSKKKK